MSEGSTSINIDSSINNNNDYIPTWIALISGACAGTSVDVALFPIDTIKTRLQSPQGFIKSGGFKGIYKGLSAAALGSAPGAAAFFTTYETFKPIIDSQISNNTTNNDINSNPLTHMISASFGEISACLIRVPTENVKQNLQTGQYKTFSNAVNMIYKHKSIYGFYTGYFTTVFREIPFSFIQFPIWERLKLIWIKYINNNNDIKPYQGAICGSISGGISGGLTTPLDVIKTRLMLGAPSNEIEYKGFIDCSSRLYIEKGFNGFWQGLTPRVTWIFIGGFFFFGAYEKSKQLLYQL